MARNDYLNNSILSVIISDLDHCVSQKDYWRNNTTMGLFKMKKLLRSSIMLSSRIYTNYS